MKGYKEVKSSVIKELKKENISCSIEDTLTGFNIEVNKYPYIFKISCIDELGWNVFLEMKEGILIEHPETDFLYSRLENIIDEINYNFYGLDENIEPLIKEGKEKVQHIAEKYSELIESIEEKDLKTILKLKEIDGKKPAMTINYSISMGIWTLKIENFFKGTNIHDSLFTIFTEANSLVQGFNNEKNSLLLTF